MARPKLRGKKPTKAEDFDDVGKLLAVATDIALRDFRFFLRFVKTIDEAEPDPLLRIKAFPVHLDYLQELAKEYQEEHFLFVEKSRRLVVTWLSAAKLVWAALQPGYHGFLQTKKEDDADWLIKERVWFIYQHLPNWLKYLALRGKTEASYKYCKLTLPNGSKIWGVAQGPDQFRGFTPSEVFIDEAAYHDLFEDSLAALLPLREKGCKLFAVSSAKPSYYGTILTDQATGLQDIMRGFKTRRLDKLPGAKVLHVHYTADPHKDPERDGREWYQKMVEQYPGGAKGSAWRQEMEIDWSAYSGQLVYEVYADSFPHVVKPFALPSDARKWRSVDYGRRNPTCCLWVAEVDSEYYVYREFYQNRTSTSEIKSLIYEMSRPDKWAYEVTWIDGSTDNIIAEDLPSVFHLLNTEPFGLGAIRADRDSAGILFINQLLEEKRLHIVNTCEKLRWEFLNYRYEDWGDIASLRYNPKEKPVKIHDHALDALKMWANGIRWHETRDKGKPEVKRHKLWNMIEKKQRLARLMGQKGMIYDG